MKKGFTLIELAVVVVLAAVTGGILYVVTLWTDSNLEFWMSYFKGQAVEVPGWLSFAITVIGNAFILAANIIAELAKLAV